MLAYVYIARRGPAHRPGAGAGVRRGPDPRARHRRRRHRHGRSPSPPRRRCSPATSPRAGRRSRCRSAACASSADVRRDPEGRRADVAAAAVEQRRACGAHRPMPACSAPRRWPPSARRAAGIPALSAQLRPGRRACWPWSAATSAPASSSAPRASPGSALGLSVGVMGLRRRDRHRRARPLDGPVQPTIRRSAAPPRSISRIVGMAYAFVAANTLMSAFQSTRQPQWPLLAMRCRWLVVVASAAGSPSRTFRRGLVGLGVVTALGLVALGSVLSRRLPLYANLEVNAMTPDSSPATSHCPRTQAKRRLRPCRRPRRERPCLCRAHRQRRRRRVRSGDAQAPLLDPRPHRAWPARW